MDLRKIRDKLRKFAQARNWDQFHTPKNLSMAMAAACPKTYAGLRKRAAAGIYPLPVQGG